MRFPCIIKVNAKAKKAEFKRSEGYPAQACQPRNKEAKAMQSHIF